MDTPSYQVSIVADVTSASEKCSLAVPYMEFHKQEFNQKRFLDVKDIFLGHRYDALQWYISIHTHGDTWGVFIPPYPNLSKCNQIWGGWKRHFLSADMMSKRLYMGKHIAKIINAKTMFGSDFYYFKSIYRSANNYFYTYLYNIMRLVHQICIDDSVECQIPYQKNQCISLIMLTIFWPVLIEKIFGAAH